MLLKLTRSGVFISCAGLRAVNGVSLFAVVSRNCEEESESTFTNVSVG